MKSINLLGVCIAVAFWMVSFGANAEEQGIDTASEAQACEALGGTVAMLDCYRALVGEIVERQLAGKFEGDALRASIDSNAQPVSKEQFGAEKLTARKDRPSGQKMTFSVDSISRTLRGRLVVITDDGQVWRQPDSDSTVVPLPKTVRGREAEIKRTMMGAYKMKIDGSGRSFRVVRVQ